MVTFLMIYFMLGLCFFVTSMTMLHLDGYRAPKRSEVGLGVVVVCCISELFFGVFVWPLTLLSMIVMACGGGDD